MKPSAAMSPAWQTALDLCAAYVYRRQRPALVVGGPQAQRDQLQDRLGPLFVAGTRDAEELRAAYHTVVWIATTSGDPQPELNMVLNCARPAGALMAIGAGAIGYWLAPNLVHEAARPTWRASTISRRLRQAGAIIEGQLSIQGPLVAAAGFCAGLLMRAGAVSTADRCYHLIAGETTVPTGSGPALLRLISSQLPASGKAPR